MIKSPKVSKNCRNIPIAVFAVCICIPNVSSYLCTYVCMYVLVLLQQFHDNIGIQEFPLLAIPSAVVAVRFYMLLLILATTVAGNCVTTLLFFLI